jgi:hypothetical protein
MSLVEISEAVPWKHYIAATTLKVVVAPIGDIDEGLAAQ